jgi:peptide/nickel transport system ATP-binding protein
MPPEPLLDVRELCVEYLTPRGPARAVDGVSFQVHRGEVFGLVGESGCGKSTIAHAILRLLGPPALVSGGQVLVQGIDVLSLDTSALRAFRWRKASLVLQSAMNALNPVLTIGEQIADVLEAHLGLPRNAALERAGTLVERVGIDRGRLASHPHQLSGGMRQRVVIALALALEPPLLVLDEPTTALDVVLQREILHQVAALRAELGFAILFITHDLSLMAALASRIGVLYGGKLVELAPTAELVERPRHPYSQGLMSSFPSLTGPRVHLTGIPGAPPDLLRLPAGCRFHPRCPQVLPQCSIETPRLEALSPVRAVACHLY